MSTVTSPDGTVIDYDRYGDGPAVIFIGGAATYPRPARGRRRGRRRPAERQPPHPAGARPPAGTRGDGAGTAGVPQVVTDAALLVQATRARPTLSSRDPTATTAST